MLTVSENISTAFLSLILPERGHFIAAIKHQKTKGFRPSTFASTIEDLWATIESADRDGCETYHACASFKEARNDPHGTPDGQKRLGRTKHNALGANALWLDIDAGPGKTYSNQNVALDALAIFCRTLNLPTPIVVTSGTGLHIYWPLPQMLDRATWERYASGVRRLCDQHNLCADHARTGDIASVLRTPGTHNHKGSKPQRVECAAEFLAGHPHPLDRYKVFLDSAEPARQPNRAAVFASVQGTSRGNRPRLLENAHAGLPEPQPAYAGEIVKHCGQLAEFRDKRGNIPEPLWYASLGVMAFCSDGEALAHEWSSGDARYTAGETQERLVRARTLTGSTTCQRLHSLNPTACERCKHWRVIKSPIALGRLPGVPVDVASPLAPELSAAPPNWEMIRGGVLKPKSYINTVIALEQLGIKFRHDTFHHRKLVEGDAVENLGPELSDSLCRALRDSIIGRFDFDPGIDNVKEAAERSCEKYRFDPILDYLDSLRWDGQARLDRWLVTYFGAEDTELTRAMGRIVLLAAVRRARHPGCKFDQIVVLEGLEGTNKSRAIALMAGKENFSDQTILGLDDRAQMELIKGKWLYEIADLTGMPKSEVDAIKAFASRTEDRARPAYGRFVTEQPRRCVFVATTNNETYLKSQTGNRRFWPVKTGRIDISALGHDRDQLWAEAAHLEASGASIELPGHLWEVARAEQEKRQEQDPWDDLLAGIKGEVHPSSDDGHGEERISSTQLLCGHLRIEPSRITDRDGKRLGYCMRRLGWFGPKAMRIAGKPAKGYSRPL